MASSPPFLPFFLLLFPLLISTTPPPPAVPPWNQMSETQAEIDALTAFRVALHDPLGALVGWDPSSPSAPFSWRGILCSPSLSPPPDVELRLPRLCLSSPISDRLATGLPFLQKLSLHQNSFSGPIPASLSRLFRLRSLFLQFNSLTGPLPPSLLTNLSDLQVFSAAGNLLTGGVPTALPGSLRFLDLSSNALARPLPDNLSAAAPCLQLLNLSFNRLRGTLPPSLARLRSLLYLWLDWNRLEGPIPAVLTNCSPVS